MNKPSAAAYPKMSNGRIFFLEVKMTTIARTNPASAPISHGVRLTLSGVAAVTPDIVQIQPTAAVTRRIANRPTVLRTVSSTVMRLVSTAPAEGAAYMPSRFACAATLTPCSCAVAAWVWAPGAAGGVSPGFCSLNAGLSNAGFLRATALTLQSRLRHNASAVC